MTTKTTTTYAQTCDRCGETRHGAGEHGMWGGKISGGAHGIGQNGLALTEAADLCPKCANDLVTWWRHPKEVAA